MECQEGKEEPARAKKTKRTWARGPIVMRPRTPQDEVAAREFLAQQKQKEPPFESREAARERLMLENQERNEEHIEKMGRIRIDQVRRDRVGACNDEEVLSQDEGIDGSQGINCSQISQISLNLSARQSSDNEAEFQEDYNEAEFQEDYIADKVAVPESPLPDKGSCQLLYEEQENSKQYLLVMSVGLISSAGRKLGDCDEEPYKSVKSVRSVHPSLSLLRDEMNRRATARGMPGLRKKTAPKPACLSWLSQHPEENTQNRTWLLKEEELYFRSLTKETEEREELDKSASSNWNSWEPFVRFYSILCRDEVRSALLCKDDSLPRQEMEARKHDDRPLDFYQLIAKYYNDDTIVISTLLLPELWYTWSYPHDLYFHDMPGGDITAEEVKKRLSDCRAKLIYVRTSLVIY